MTDPRVEAAAKAQHALEDESTLEHTFEGCEFADDYRSTCTAILAAADEADRVAGVVRVDTRDEALIDRMAHLIDQMPASGSATIAMTLLDEIAAVDRLLAALATAGAQPPPKEDAHG